MHILKSAFEKWTVSYHRSMSAVSQLGLAISRSRSKWLLVRKLSSMDARFSELLSDLRNLEDVPLCILLDLSHKLRSLGDAAEDLMALATRAGLTDHFFFGIYFYRLRDRLFDLSDTVERFESSLDYRLAATAKIARPGVAVQGAGSLEAVLQS